MTLHIILWFSWFFAASWLQNTAIVCKDVFAKGVHAMKKVGSALVALLVIVGLFAILPKPALAQSDVDPPGRVARLNFLEGSVSYQVSGDTDWVQADPNRPLTTGDNLWVDQNSRGEVHVGSTAIRLSAETGISFLNLDDRTAQIQLAQGTIEVHLRNLEPGDAWEIDTPNLAFTLTRAGEYRISTDPNSNTTAIAVREGEGSVTGGGESWDLVPGQQYTFNGTDELSYDAQPGPGFDDFESWCQTRDQLENNSPSARYVSRDVDGYYDLDQNGSWESDADYGEVWVPRGVEVGWAPYHQGHWVWVAPWGWTWVDAEPWGWAPFHYGRWAYVRGGYWGWVPGPLVVRPVYAPALVGFVGGGGFSLSVAIGGGFTGVAWFPLGPRDVFVPSYHCSERYVQTVNVTNTRVVNVTQVTNVYNTVIVNNNRNVAVNNVHYTYENNSRAVTAVSKETFINARPVQASAVRVSDEDIKNVRVVENAPMAPTRASYISSTARVTTAKPSVPLAQRPVVARLTPATPVNRRTPQYTNDSKTFAQPSNRTNQTMAEPNRANPTPAQPNRTNGANAQGNESNNGFRPFTPANTNNQNEPKNQNQNVNRNETNQNINNVTRNNENITRENTRPPVENEVKPPVRYSPPVKARDENYDVHPPLNQKPPQPKPEEKPKPQPKPQPKPHDEKPHSRG
jgi:hypothetical protein